MSKKQPENKTTYCSTRLAKYGIIPVAEVSVLENDTAGDKVKLKKVKKKIEFFKPNEADGIDIVYLELTGHIVRYRKPGTKWERPFIRQRLNPTKASDDQKYTQEKDSGVHIHLNPQIIEKYQNKTKIDTLYMTEGEFKAWTAYQHGIDIVGLPSIHAYKEKINDELHTDLQAIIKTCKVQNLVMIYDADILSVKWEKWEKNEDYDLGKKFNSFYKSAMNIREYAKQLVKDVYLCHIDTEFLREYVNDEQVKGLDDLFMLHKGREKDVVKELQLLRSSKKMFSYINISAESPAKIRQYFGLIKDKEGRPSVFYNTHQNKIGTKEFVFLGFRYQYSQKLEGLEIVRHPDSDKFIRVACDYIKVIEIPENIRGIKVTRRKLEPWKSGELSRDYVNKGFKNFFDTIQKYDQFSVYPDNTDKYKQVIDNCYNLYYKITHVPTEGNFKTIEMFLKHLFEEHYEMCLDYLQLLYLMPYQPLPIIALVSEERGTGKTKFLELLREIFCENVTILGNDAITDNYNDDYASKLVIGIDEGLIEKKATVEKIKSWSTATRIKMNTKFMSRQEIPFYGKIIITSNNTDSFIQIEDQETRFWIRKVKPVGKEDPDLMLKMEKEIPAFLHFLKGREMLHPKVTRQWFAYNLLHTEALTEIKLNSRGWLEKELSEAIQEEFFKYQYYCLPYTITDLVVLLNGKNAGARFRASEIRKVIENKYKTKSFLKRALFPVHDVDGFNKTLKTKESGRYYHLFIEDFLNTDELKEMGYNLEQLSVLHDEFKKTGNAIEYWANEKPKLNYQQSSLPLETSNNVNTDDLPF